jgi:hypothetical protein
MQYTKTELALQRREGKGKLVLPIAWYARTMVVCGFLLLEITTYHTAGEAHKKMSPWTRHAEVNAAR